ncbi:ABC transporter ATP-binding protein [candidate division KSB1 bacterium 4484_87]|nr:MAG: ABC transporter ATP-binding protein [candidate division KSB1 bacterium 4484_87]
MVEVKNIYKSFGSKEILSGVNLTLKDGEILSIIGKSGTGKSVLLKLIIGLISPDSGQIVVDGVDVTEFSEGEFNEKIRTKMSMVFQEGALWDSMTVAENIELALKIRKHLPEEERKQIISESLRLVGLDDVENKFPDELSGGMMKRAAIARAIAIRPKYLFYDEPTTGLDPVLSNIINGLILSLTKKLNTTALIISHDIDGVARISDRVAMLHEGKIILICNAKEMWNQQNEIFNHFIHGDTELT